MPTVAALGETGRASQKENDCEIRDSRPCREKRGDRVALLSRAIGAQQLCIEFGRAVEARLGQTFIDAVRRGQSL